MTTTHIDYYDVLGVAENATPEQLRQAFRRQARASHPDTGGDEAQFRLVRQAYETLSNPRDRATYDRERAYVPPPVDDRSPWGVGQPPPSQQSPYTYTFEQDYGFGQQQAPPNRTSPPRANAQGGNLRPQPGGAGHPTKASHSMPGLRYTAAVNAQLVGFRLSAALVTFLFVAFRHLPLNMVLEYYELNPTTIRVPLDFALIAGLVMFFAAPRLWLWASTPGNRWKAALVILVLFLGEVVFAAVILTAVVAVAVALFAVTTGLQLARR